MTRFTTHIERNVQLDATPVMMQRIGLGYSDDGPQVPDNWQLIVEFGIQPNHGGPPDEFDV